MLAIYRRELFAYTLSATAYVVLFSFLLANGVTFQLYLRTSGGHVESILGGMFGSVVFWFLMVLIPPLLTMRCFAEERRCGTYELLVTTGMGESTLVVGKFLAAWTYWLLMWASLTPLLLLIDRHGQLDWGVVLAIAIGIALVGGLFVAIGVLASTFTQNQIVAASLSMVLNLLLFFVNYFKNFFANGDLARRWFEFLSPFGHFSGDFLQGVVDARSLVLYPSCIIFTLFLGAKSLERRRWW